MTRYYLVMAALASIWLSISHANAYTIIDTFSSGDAAVTQDTMRERNVAGLSLISANLPDVAGRSRKIGMGSFSADMLADPSAAVEITVVNDRISVASNYFAEQMSLRYGGADNPLVLDIEDSDQTTLSVDFDYFIADVDGQSELRLLVGGSDVNGDLRPNASDPLYYAYSRALSVPNSSLPFRMLIPFDTLTHRGPEVELANVYALDLSISPLPGSHSFAISDIRVVPEPNAAIQLIAALLILSRIYKRALS